MGKKQNHDHKKSGMELILAIVSLFFAAMLLIAAIGQFRNGRNVTGAVSICGMLLFGAVGGVLLISELRHWRNNHKKKG